MISHIRTGIYTLSRLLDGTECQLLLDTGANKSIHVEIILYTLQITSFFAKICVKNTKNPGRKWSIC